jgi:hypothetical protein
MIDSASPLALHAMLMAARSLSQSLLASPKSPDAFRREILKHADFIVIAIRKHG